MRSPDSALHAYDKVQLDLSGTLQSCCARSDALAGTLYASAAAISLRGSLKQVLEERPFLRKHDQTGLHVWAALLLLAARTLLHLYWCLNSILTSKHNLI